MNIKDPSSDQKKVLSAVCGLFCPSCIIYIAQRESPEKQKASIEIFAEIVTGLKDLCQGIHIITIGGEENLRHYLDSAKLL